MNRSLKRMALAALLCGTFGTGAAHACDGRGRGGIVRAVVSQPVFNRVSHGQPAYQQPIYRQPAYQQPIYQQPVYQQPIHQQPVYQQPIHQQPVYQQPIHQQSGGYQQSITPSVGNQQSVSGPTGFPQAGSQVVNQQPVGNGQSAQGPALGGQPSTNQQQFIPSSGGQQGNAAANASPLNALQMLSGNDQNTANSNTDASIPDFTPVSTAVSPSQSPEYVGVWAARVGNSSEVQLRLEATGAFEWSANSNGKVSSFRGSFSVDNGALKLLREDNQQLVGSFQMSNSNAFSFTVANANGLQFQRR